jgi:hypothetical protein
VRAKVRILCLSGNARPRRSCARHGTRLQRLESSGETFDTGFQRDTKALEMNADAWNHLADRSRVLVHQASRLMGVLTHPTQSHDDWLLAPIAAEAAFALQRLLEAMTAAPELAAHVRTIQRFDIALAAWRRSVADASPLAPRYQTALLQQAAQVVTSCLHVGALSDSESARTLVTRRDVAARAGPPPP